MALEDKLNKISSEIQEGEKTLESKKKTKKRLEEMLKKQKNAQETFSVENLIYDPVYNKAVRQGNTELIQKLKNRSLTGEEYDLWLRYDAIKPAGFGYVYVTKQGKKGLVTIGDNREILEPIYDEVYINDNREKGINEKTTSTRGISYAVKGKEIYFFDTYKGFEEIDITGYNANDITRRGGGGYVLYKTQGKNKNEEYVLGRNTETNEIIITKKA